jgi:hypothetical protein
MLDNLEETAKAVMRVAFALSLSIVFASAAAGVAALAFRAIF